MIHGRKKHRLGFTLVEAIVCIGIVGVMVAPTLYVVGASRSARMLSENRARACLLADALLVEILNKPYADPQTPDAALGLDSGEGMGPGRGSFDDVDDYDGWSASPLRRRGGAHVHGADGLTRSAWVGYVKPDDLDNRVAADTDLKRITVAVSRGGVVLAELSALRSSARPEPESELD